MSMPGQAGPQPSAHPQPRSRPNSQVCSAAGLVQTQLVPHPAPCAGSGRGALPLQPVQTSLAAPPQPGGKSSRFFCPPSKPAEAASQPSAPEAPPPAARQQPPDSLLDDVLFGATQQPSQPRTFKRKIGTSYNKPSGGSQPSRLDGTQPGAEPAQPEAATRAAFTQPLAAQHSCQQQGNKALPQTSSEQAGSAAAQPGLSSRTRYEGQGEAQRRVSSPGNTTPASREQQPQRISHDAADEPAGVDDLDWDADAGCNELAAEQDAEPEPPSPPARAPSPDLPKTRHA